MPIPISLDAWDLPIREIIPQIRAHFSKANRLILSAPPGAGKSTLLPLALLEEPWLKSKKILLLEPRRLATKSTATRMAAMLEDPVGNVVGYQIRFDRACSGQTRLEVITEGILSRKMQEDNALEDIGLVIFDEFHERNIFSEVGLALLLEVQEVLRPDLRILLMSATMDSDRLGDLLSSQVIRSEGRQFPVEIKHLEDIDSYRIGEDTARQVLSLLPIHQGDFLVFLPGQGDIHSATKVLQQSTADTLICPLYGQLPALAQQRAIFPDPQGRRKIVLATDIAETSLTIEGICVVVDAGFAKSNRFDPRSGLSRLELHRISQDAADQRSGRAGRLQAGHAYRLWSKATHLRLEPYRKPEILEADLCPMVLELKCWGISDILSMKWLTLPPLGSIHSAVEVLESIDALHEDIVTAHGKAIQKLPVHPRIGHMLRYAETHGLLAVATDLAALLEERDPLNAEQGVDINLRLDGLRRFRSQKVGGLGFKKIEKIAHQYRRYFKIQEINDTVDPWETGILLAYAYPERIASARPGANAQFQLANGKIAQMSHKDDLAFESWLSIAHLDAREGIGKIWLAAPLNPQDLIPLTKRKDSLRWDRKKGGLIAQSEVRIGAILLGVRPLKEISQAQLQETIQQAISDEGAFLLDWNEEAIQVLNRIRSLRHWNPTQPWPDWSIASCCNTAETWLSPYLIGQTKNEELKKLNISQILQHSLSPAQQQLLLDLAPTHIEVPTGSRIRLHYLDDGQAPLLSVRLQELFGQVDTPRINREQIGVRIQLLSPGYKPVQLTGDLRSFWTQGYFEVKKELKRRYPKHAWPEDPLQALPVRGIQKNKS